MYKPAAISSDFRHFDELATLVLFHIQVESEREKNMHTTVITSIQIWNTGMYLKQIALNF